jgi:DNA gyrase subunit A
MHHMTDQRLRMARDREHVLVSLERAQADWETAMRCISTAANDDEARAALAEAFDLDDVQATTVLDMQFRRISVQNRDRVAEELAQLREEIARLSNRSE